MSTELVKITEDYSELHLTLEEALEVASRQPEAGASSRREEYGWHGGSFEDNMRMAWEGDPETALQIKKNLGGVAGIHVAPRATRFLGVAGSQVDMSRFMRGEPENMVEVRRARRAAPVIRMAIERTQSAAVRAETMRQTGVSVLAVIERLRTAGVAAEIWVTFGVYYGNKKHSTQILIQEAGRPIDIDRLAYWVANAGALRRIVFAIWENQSDEFIRDFNIYGNYGYSMTTPADKFDELVPANAVTAKEWIGEVLKRRAGIELRTGHDVQARSDWQ